MCEQGLLKGVNLDIGICRFALLGHSVTWTAPSQSLASGLGVHGAHSQAPTVRTSGRPLSPAQNHPGSTLPGSREMRWGQGGHKPSNSSHLPPAHVVSEPQAFPQFLSTNQPPRLQAHGLEFSLCFQVRYCLPFFPSFQSLLLLFSCHGPLSRSLSLLYGHLVAFQGTGQDSDKHTLYLSGSTRCHLVKFIQTKY